MEQQILIFSIPVLLVILAGGIYLHARRKKEQDQRMWELKRLSQKEISPIRMQAYERLCLLLERTQPEHMLTETSVTTMTVLQLQQHLLRTIRTEFDHNMSQQIYVSNEVWNKIILARDEMAAFVCSIAQQIPSDSTALDYAKALLTAYRNNGETPHELALDALKDEAKTLL